MDYTKKIRFGLGSFCAAFLLLSVLALQVASQDAPNFVGTWQMTMLAGGQGGGQGGQGGNGQGDAQPGDQGEGGGRRGGGGGRGPQTLVIAKDGDNYKVTHKTQRGDKTYDATVSGNVGLRRDLPSLISQPLPPPAVILFRLFLFCDRKRGT